MKLTPMRKRLLRIYAWCLGLGGLYLIWLLLTGLRIPCPLYEITGISCPGCGTTRMFLALARLDLAAAFAFNPAMLTAFFFWNAAALLLWLGHPRWLAKPWVLYTLLALTSAGILIFGMIRIFR